MATHAQRFFLSLILAFGMQAANAAPETPAPGTALRQDLLDAIRVFAGFDLGPPIEFVVIELKADGDLAFARVMAQRPGGAPIDIAETPMVERDQMPVDLIDGPRMEAFLIRSEGKWYIDAYAIGATDVWWVAPPFCAQYAEFLPTQACN